MFLRYFRSVKIRTPRENSDGKRTRNDKFGLNKFNPIKASQNNPTIRCFNCNQIGHPSFRCDKPLIKCTNCDRIGHQSTDCARVMLYKQTENRPDKNKKQVSDVSVADKTNNKYIMGIRVNGIPFKCHLDLGSQCTLMRESDAKLLNLNLHTDIELPIAIVYAQSTLNIVYAKFTLS